MQGFVLVYHGSWEDIAILVAVATHTVRGHRGLARRGDHMGKLRTSRLSRANWRDWVE